LLLQRHDRQGRRAPGADSQADAGTDPRSHERAPVPLRHLSARDEGDRARRSQDGGRDAMSTIMSDRVPGALSRRDLLKSGGPLLVGFSIGGPTAAAAAARGEAAGPPDPNTIDTWIAVHADNTATIYLGKGEFGQGNTTGLLQIAGEELDLDMSQLKWVQL